MRIQRTGPGPGIISQIARRVMARSAPSCPAEGTAGGSRTASKPVASSSTRWAVAAVLAAAGMFSSACVYEGPATDLDHQDIHLTFLHTADWHSRLIPYDFTVGQVDLNLGLSQDNGPFGGAARMSYLLGRERARAGRVLHLDSGDCFQGAPIFNYFRGEAEMRALGMTGVDAMVIGNHEFDVGGQNFAEQASRWATFPTLAANYLYEPVDPDAVAPMNVAEVSEPYTIFNVDGLKVGVIGMANLSSLSSIFEQPNRLGIVPLESVAVAQFYIDFLRPQVDLIVMLTHLGLNSDMHLVENTSGIDVLLGGHLHIVLNPPALVNDCANVDADGRHYIEFDNGTDPKEPKIRRYCRPREVVVAHSGAFMKYLGRLDVVLSNDPARVQPNPPDAYPESTYDPNLDGYELVAHQFQLFPLDASVPEDPVVAEMLEPYELALANLVDLDLLVGYAPQIVRRFGTRSGDSELGNLIADSMLLRLGIQTDFALTNTTGIRTDLTPGPVSAEQLFNVFPFDNTVAKMFMTGREAQEMFDFVARRSTARGCSSQAQIAGARVVIDCSGQGCPGGEPCATQVAIGRGDVPCSHDEDCGEGLCDRRPSIPREDWRCMLPLSPDASYELATSNYLAGGGSGFSVLRRNTTQQDTLLPMRDVLTDYLRNGSPCGADPITGALPSCTTDAECPGEAFYCACASRAVFDENIGMCVGPEMTQDCNGGSGRCVLQACRDDVAQFHIARSCADVFDPREKARCECDAVADAGEQCKFLACIDERLGATMDGRIDMRAF